MRFLLILPLATVAWCQQQSSFDKQLASIQKQWECAEKQRAATVKTAAAPPPFGSAPAPAADCPALGKEEVSGVIAGAAEYTGLTHDLLTAVIEKESAFTPCAVSSKGALGLMQLMPAVIKDFEVADPLDPIENVQAGSRFLKSLITRFGGDLRLALAAYNAGLSRVEKDGQVPQIPETVNYVNGILRKLGIE